MNKLQQLIKAAKAATPGPWKSGEFSIDHFLDTNHKYFVESELRRVASVEGLGVAYESDATFIAIANPATILELCALLEKAEEALTLVGDKIVLDYGSGHFAVQRLDKPAIDDALAAIKQWKEPTKPQHGKPDDFWSSDGIGTALSDLGVF